LDCSSWIPSAPSWSHRRYGKKLRHGCRKYHSVQLSHHGLVRSQLRARRGPSLLRLRRRRCRVCLSFCSGPYLVRGLCCDIKTFKKESFNEVVDIALHRKMPNYLAVYASVISFLANLTE